jgi:uncharacterized tellurite resistance protein B-like protein|tara:strand:+ start:1012 stop:1536 length:525 start_codon:yes stop_codon:yes gene_type:complete
MHLLIALLTAIATLLFALDRIGIDIGWLNPWAWRRRRQWMKQLNANPAFNLDTPMEAMALLLLATARIDGDLSSDEKQELRKIFEDSFNQNTRDSSALLSSSTYLLGDGLEVFKRPQDVVSKSLEKFSSEQRESSIQLLTRISEVSGPASDSQKDYISSIRGVFYSSKDKGSWE